jgi:hypothetical protein
MAGRYPDIPLSEYRPRSLLERHANVHERARFPVVHARNRLMDDPAPVSMIAVMEGAGVKTFIDLTGNTRQIFPESGCPFGVRDLGFFIYNYVRKHPGRFTRFTMSDFPDIEYSVLIEDGSIAGRAAGAILEEIKKMLNNDPLTR